MRVDSIWHCYSILEVSPTESQLGFGMSVVRAGVGIFVVMLMLGELQGKISTRIPNPSVTPVVGKSGKNSNTGTAGLSLPLISEISTIIFMDLSTCLFPGKCDSLRLTCHKI